MEEAEWVKGADCSCNEEARWVGWVVPILQIRQLRPSEEMSVSSPGHPAGRWAFITGAQAFPWTCWAPAHGPQPWSLTCGCVPSAPTLLRPQYLQEMEDLQLKHRGSCQRTVTCTSAWPPSWQLEEIEKERDQVSPACCVPSPRSHQGIWGEAGGTGIADKQYTGQFRMGHVGQEKQTGGPG